MKILIVDDNQTNLMLLRQFVGRLTDCEPLDPRIPSAEITAFIKAWLKHSDIRAGEAA
jgi:hypothetical protein